MNSDFLCIVHNIGSLKSGRVDGQSWGQIEKIFRDVGLRQLPEPTRVYIVWVNRFKKRLNNQGIFALFRSGSTFYTAYNLTSFDDPSETRLETYNFEDINEDFNFITDELLQLSASEKLDLYNRLVVFPDEHEIEEQTERLKAAKAYSSNRLFGRF